MHDTLYFHFFIKHLQIPLLAQLSKVRRKFSCSSLYNVILHMSVNWRSCNKNPISEDTNQNVLLPKILD